MFTTLIGSVFPDGARANTEVCRVAVSCVARVGRKLPPPVGMRVRTGGL